LDFAGVRKGLNQLKIWELAASVANNAIDKMQDHLQKMHAEGDIDGVVAGRTVLKQITDVKDDMKASKQLIKLTKDSEVRSLELAKMVKRCRMEEQRTRQVRKLVMANNFQTLEMPLDSLGIFELTAHVGAQGIMLETMEYLNSQNYSFEELRNIAVKYNTLVPSMSPISTAMPARSTITCARISEHDIYACTTQCNFSDLLVGQHNVEFASATFLQASGLQWKMLDTQPTEGRELINSKLALALTIKQEFTQNEWNALNITCLRKDDFIKSNASYFKPVVHAENNSTAALIVESLFNTQVMEYGDPKCTLVKEFADIGLTVCGLWMID